VDPGDIQKPVSIKMISRELGLSPSRIRQLTDAGVLSAVRTEGGHRRYDLAATRAAWRRYRLEQAGITDLDPARSSDGDRVVFDQSFALEGLEEDRVWNEVVKTLDLAERSAARRILAYGLTEMVNNAVDHSGGSAVHVRAVLGEGAVELIIEDDGRGVFDTLAIGLELPDQLTAIQELTKGKRTTAPDTHTGEGIFFTSKSVDVFRLAANGYVWTVDNLRNDHAVGVSWVHRGTSVRLQIDLETERDLTALFSEFTENYEFTRTRPVVKLFEIGVTFVSRSEAKRLLAGLEDFTEVEIDFSGVDSVGQGFVDEMLRVWPREHPGTTLIPTGMNPAVEFMVRRGIGGS
jgi:anti-sigma regulatory factor (Ser/Thr protein kinase)